MGESEMSDFENKELRITATGESVMVTKEEVDKARADYNAAAEAACDAAREASYDDSYAGAAGDAAYAEILARRKYIKLKEEYEMVTKEDKAKAAYAAAVEAVEAAEAAWSNYIKLKEEYLNGSN
jgi:hypothetical protein